jgi:DNA-binding CsgD family transcriptional regulator
VVAAKTRSDRRWRLRNGEIIRHLEEGRSVAEIALLMGRGQRQIRTVRERLKDMRD